MQILVMTSDKQEHCLEPFMWLWHKYFTKPKDRFLPDQQVNQIICGFTKPDYIDFDKYGWHWYSIGNFEDYPPQKWSNAFIKVLNEVAHPQFMLMLEDYWVCREVDVVGIHNLFGYAKQFDYLLKADVSTDRLYADYGRFERGGSGYGHCGHLDLIKSEPGSNYQMSLWGGIWNRETIKRFIVPDERAQEVELMGTTRVNSVGDQVLVIGTRSSPIRHGNVYRSAGNGAEYKDPFGDNWELSKEDLEEMRRIGIWKK